MSNDGDVWIALTTCNTDSNVLMLFMSYLASQLTKESPDWRANTVFLLDGVSTSMLLLNLLSRLPIISLTKLVLVMLAWE